MGKGKRQAAVDAQLIGHNGSVGAGDGPVFAGDAADFQAARQLFDGIADVGAFSSSISRSSDGLHPNQAGHVTMASVLAPVLTAALPP